MLIKKKTPWGVLLLLLLLMEITSYYIAGLFSLENVTLANYEESLNYIFMNPFHNWWNEKTFAILSLALVGWMMMVSYYLTHYRDFHTNEEHGVAKWENVRKVSKKLKSTKSEVVTYLSRNISFGIEALPNLNILVIGGSGSGKTTSLLVPNLLAANVTNIFMDIKGELFRNYAPYLKAHGVTVKVLNFKNPLESDRYNPFAYIHSNTDLIELIKNIQESMKPENSTRGDPFWDDGLGLYLQSVFEYEWLEAKEQGRQATMNNILKLINMESHKIEKQIPGQDEPVITTELQEKMDELAERYGHDYPPVREYRKLKDGAPDTVRSIIIMANAQLRLFDLPEIQRIFEDDDLDIPSFGLGVDGNPKKKTAVFLVMRSRDKAFNLFLNMFYNQLFRVLLDMADDQCPGGELPVHVRLWADEMYAGTRPQNMEHLLSEIRGRNVSIVSMLQDIAQLKTMYPNNQWEIFTDNCASAVYLGAGPMATGTQKWMSDMLDESTVESKSETIGKNGSMQVSTKGIKLMSESQIAKLNEDHCLITMQGYDPIYDRKNWPFETKIFKEARSLSGEIGYHNPVLVEYDEKTRKYRTLECDDRIRTITQEEFEFYQEKEKNDDTVHTFTVDEEQFLYMNWDQAVTTPSQEMLEEFARQLHPSKHMPIPEDAKAEVDIGTQKARPKKNMKDYKNGSAAEQEPDKREKTWDLSGSILDCLLRYHDALTLEEREEIIGGVEDGLAEKDIKRYFAMHDAVKMHQYRRAYAAGK